MTWNWIYSLFTWFFFSVFLQKKTKDKMQLLGPFRPCPSIHWLLTRDRTRRFKETSVCPSIHLFPFILKLSSSPRFLLFCFLCNDSSALFTLSSPSFSSSFQLFLGRNPFLLLFSHASCDPARISAYIYLKLAAFPPTCFACLSLHIIFKFGCLCTEVITCVLGLWAQLMDKIWLLSLVKKNVFQVPTWNTWICCLYHKFYSFLYDKQNEWV